MSAFAAPSVARAAATPAAASCSSRRRVVDGSRQVVAVAAAPRRRRHRTAPIAAAAEEGEGLGAAAAAAPPTKPTTATSPRRAVLGGVAAGSVASLLWGVGGPKGLAYPPIVFAAEEEAASASSVAAVAVVESEGAILITGANSGVGFSAAKQLAAQGKRVVLACRTEAKALAAAAAIRETVPDAQLVVLPGAALEMADLRATADYVKAFQDSGIPLDVLLLNAGMVGAPLARTAQDHELLFGVNHLAHFLMQDALVPQLRGCEARTGRAGRLVACSSLGSAAGGTALDLSDLDWRRRKYSGWLGYCASKACNVLMTDEVARREGPRVVSNSFHPGSVATNLTRSIAPGLAVENVTEKKIADNAAMLARLSIRSADQGAKTHVWLSTAEEAGGVSGGFFIDPGVQYPGATREQLIAATDWFLPTGREPLAPQLRLPERLFEWRTEANASGLWAQSMEMIEPFRA
eukprot:CAMPEP_0197579318 /NCGR_PEP_ID=MMETSP1326-20131121/3342_1 /TAXON_ID=1155430 /ORGANISM="Genus nov. species nov., Strain RCC2288" /LENGTH=463 /DNA_ID=CAMNT_0043142743 /DNA_START=113 /DNA_END=1507 /DNA_ORIENTATION=+